ncbi:MAG: anti-sigma factor antagonist [Oscillospiraceae bacterium]|jgi:stage II sporulation protein AA (anti-sigma F factor antagonist)|nr:anti-sigma factor antagonist [Oscillospiraceae bacterium]
MSLKVKGVELILKNHELLAKLSGDIDQHSAKGMRDEIDLAIKDFRPLLLILDFGDVKFMDSSGIGLIMGRYNLAKSYGASLKIQNVSPRLEKIIKLAGVGILGVL